MAGQVADEAVVDAVLTASRTLVAVATRSLGAAAEDTTIAQYRALVVLASQGPQRMVDIAAALDVTPPTAGRMCDRLLRRGTDIDRPPAADPFEDLSAADAMRPFAAPLTLAAQPPGRPGGPGPDRAPLPGPVTHQHHPQVLFAGAVPRPGPAPAGTLQPRRAAGDLRRRAAPARVDHQPERAAGCRPPHACHPGRHRAGTARRRAGPPRPTGRPPRAAGPVARLSRSWRSPSRPARPPPDKHWATPAGRPAGSRSRSWTTTPCATPTPASPWPPATGSACSSPNHAAQDQHARPASRPISQTPSPRMRHPPHRRRLPHPASNPPARSRRSVRPSV